MAGVLGYCTTLTHPSPLATSGGGTAALRVHVLHQMHIVWSTGSPDVIDPPTACISAYDGTSVVDSSQFVWLVVLVQGAPAPVLLKELDYVTISVVSGINGTYALYARIDGDSCYLVPQV